MGLKERHHASGVRGSRQMSSSGGGFIAGQAGIGDEGFVIIDYRY